MATHVNRVQRFVVALVIVTSPTWVHAQGTLVVAQATVSEASRESPLAGASGGPLQQAAVREAARLAQEPTASQPKPKAEEKSWAARHKWATVGILAAVGVVAYIGIYAYANAD